MTHQLLSYLVRFLSTPSARRATGPVCVGDLSDIISIHALREEGDPATPEISRPRLISIHALREEGDIGTSTGRGRLSDFYPPAPREMYPLSRLAALPIL